MVRIARIAEIYMRLATHTVGKEWNLKYTELRLLNVLDHAGKLSIREISRRTYIDKAWVSRSIVELEKKHFVQRESAPSDSRITLLSLTSKGQKILNEIRPYLLESEKILLSNVNEKALKTMLDQLKTNALDMLEEVEK